MTNSPGSQPRSEIAPPRESTARGQRTGYLVLAASGVVLATAFGAAAQFLGPDSAAVDTVATARTGHDGDTGGTGLVPGQAVPGETTVVIDGVAVTGTLPSSTTSPTTVVSTGPDGRTTTTVITPSRTRTTTSSSTGTSKEPGNTEPTETSSQLPPSSSTGDTDPSDPTDPTDTSPSTTEPTETSSTPMQTPEPGVPGSQDA